MHAAIRISPAFASGNALVALSADMSEMPLPPEDGSVQKGRRNHNCSSHSESHAEKTNCGPERILRAQGGMDEDYAVA